MVWPTGFEFWMADALLFCTCTALVGWRRKSRSPSRKSSMSTRGVATAPWRMGERMPHSHSSFRNTDKNIGGDLSNQDILEIIRGILSENAEKLKTPCSEDLSPARDMLQKFAESIGLMDYLQPLRGCVIRITGCPNSGKSSLAESIAATLNCKITSKKDSVWKYSLNSGKRMFEVLYLCNDCYNNFTAMKRDFDQSKSYLKGAGMIVVEGHRLQETPEFDDSIDTAVHISASDNTVRQKRGGSRKAIDSGIVDRYKNSLHQYPLRCTIRLGATVPKVENVFLVIVMQILKSRNECNFFGRQLTSIHCSDLEYSNVCVV